MIRRAYRKTATCKLHVAKLLFTACVFDHHGFNGHIQLFADQCGNGLPYTLTDLRFGVEDGD